MAIRRLRLHIPLFLRELTLRILLSTATATLAVNISTLVHTERGLPAWYWVSQLLPLLLIPHHILRLWQWRRWLVICEVITSLAEVVAVGFFYIPDIQGRVSYFQQAESATDPYVLLVMGFDLAMVASSFISCLILFCDTLTNHWKTLFRRYSFSADLRQQGQEWSFMFGKFAIKKRFSTDNLLIRYIRGGVAVLILLGMLSLVFYASVWQPMQGSDRPGVKTFRVPIDVEGDLFAALDTQARAVDPKDFLMGESGIDMVFQAILMMPKYPTPNQYPTMNLNITWSSVKSADTNKIVRCQQSQTQDAVQIYCLTPAPLGGQTVKLLLIANFSGVLGDFPVYLALGFAPASIDDIITAEPIGVRPGLNLHGWSSIVVKERLSNQKAATFGIPGYRRFSVIKTRSLSTDWLPSLPRDNNTATLRLTFEPQRDIEVEQEYMEGSVINGFALVGGVWTLVNGVFATIFGSTLLLVLFGIKPLSIYGLIHRLRPGRGSLVDANYTLSPEERDRIVGILREHLLDVDDAEGDKTSSSHYNTVSSENDTGTHA